MRPRALLGALVLLLLIAFTGQANAVYVHNFSCKDCHKPNTTITGLGIGTTNVCLQCHTDTSPQSPVFQDARSDTSTGVFSVLDASDALISTSPKGSSHRWAGIADNAAAGASDPPRAFYYSRYGISSKKVTCGRCHDPHADMANPQLLRPITQAEYCLECHSNWNIANPDALLTHPVNIDYASFAGNPGYKAAIDPTNGGLAVNSTVALVNGKISCGTCHGVHFTDSDASTVDGYEGNYGDGDGYLLRSDGPSPDPALPEAEKAQKRSNLCQACHTYKIHGTTSPIGCLDCHGGHSYNGGTPNYFILRNEASTATYGDVTGLNYTSTVRAWSDGNTGSANGYCERCHGEIGTYSVSHSDSTLTQTDCIGCHAHGGTSHSFEAVGGCTTCHGDPPTTNDTGTSTGYAAGYTPLKDESQTPHAAHAAGGGDYDFPCAVCHLNNSHNTGTFQDVFLGTDHALATGDGNMSPAYNPAGSGTCSAVYCHSNGGARSGDASRTYVAASIAAWDLGAGAITTCDACHDNSASMTNGSAAHAAHLALTGVTCKTCHVTTAASANSLVAGAMAAGGSHVNGVKNVAFDTSGFISVGATPYTAATGTCSVYCHSNGTTLVVPDWDEAASGDCGACHQYANAGVATGTGPALGGAHAKHLYAANGGVQLACTTCHTNAGSGADHVNGTINYVANYQTAVCNACHGASNGVTVGNDRQPVWTDANSVDCQTCHMGSVFASISGRSAPAKSSFATAGHGSISAFNTAYPADPCSACHATSAAHFNGIADDHMLSGGAAANSAFCQTCHSAVNYTVHNAAANGSSAGDSCLICHDSHGEGMGGNTGAMLIVGTGYVDGATRASFANAAGTGVCQTCHSASVTHFNSAPTDETATHQGSASCTTCHAHGNTPAFMYGAGTACNSCHDFPPATGAHRTGTSLSDDELHSSTSTSDKDVEDLSDCAKCHTGADLYTYDPAADQQSGTPGRLNHNNGADAAAKLANRQAVLSSSVGYNSVDGTCASACHLSTVGNGGAWSATVGLSCDACHYYEIAPTDANNTAAGAGNTLTGSHGKHFGAGGIATCTTCHVDNGSTAISGPLTHVTTAPTGTDLAKIQGRADALPNEAEVTVTTWNDTADSCSNAACHNPSGEVAYSATWAVANVAGCAFCHSSTEPATGSHGSHMNAGISAGGAFGKDIVCTDCHIDNGIDNAHRDGSVTFAAGMNYTAGAVDVGGAVGTCTTTTCHNDGKATPSEVPTPSWGTTSADCSICHGNGPANGKHAEHVGSTTYVPGSCSDCHTAANSGSHINGTRNMANKVASYTSATQTCANSCHIADTTGDWTAGGALACSDCHDSTLLVDKGWPPAGDAHDKHVAETDYVNDANCTDCHGDNTDTHSVLNGSAVVGGNNVNSFNNTDGTCANNCHAAGNFRTPTALACTDCHQAGTYIGSGANLPISGLHNATVAQNHGASIGGTGCTECHSATPSAGHLNATLQNSSATTYTFGVKINSYSANGCAATCHDDATANGSNGKWSRRWAGAVDAKPTASDEPGAAVCDNCHGDGITAGTTTVDNLWRTGLSPAHQDSPDSDTDIEMLEPGYHGKCKTCHGYGDAGYDAAWGASHGNGTLSMNGPGGTGAGYDETQFGCLIACHTGSLANGSGDPNENHVLTDSGWTIDFGNYGSGDCTTCHAGAGRDHGGATTESLVTHDLHTGSGFIASDCTQCHPHDGQTVAPGTGIHADGTVNFNNSKVPSSYDYAGNDFAGNCSTNTCHDTDDASEEWFNVSLGADACADCHNSGKTGIFSGLSAYPPTSDKHGLHLANTAMIANCSECHGHNGTLSSVAPFANHIDGSLAIGDQLTSYTSPTCANSCHNLAGNGSGAASWPTANANPLGCDDCHNKAANTLGAPIHAGMSNSAGPATGKHGSHVGAAVSYMGAEACVTCHKHKGELGATGLAADHATGAISYDAAVTDYVSGDQTCTNVCHNVVDTRDWTAGTLACTDCHTTAKTLGAAGAAGMSAGVAPATGRHTAHMNNDNYVPNNCTDCHGHVGALAGGSNGHVAGPDKTAIGLNGQVSAGTLPADDTCTNTCHLVVDGRDWIAGAVTNGTALACADCHNAAGKSLNQGAWPPVSAAHSGHMASNALPNAVQSDCYACHGNTIDNSGALAGSGHLNLTAGDISLSSSFNYQGVAVTLGGAAGTTRTCSNVLCHNGATTPSWGSGAITCGKCHGDGTGPLPTGSIAGDHSLHANNDTNYSDCANCHINAGSYTAKSSAGGQADHQNLSADVAFPAGTLPGATYTDGNGGAGVNYAGDFTDNGTCASVECHFDSTTPAWNAPASAYPARCVVCHNDGSAGTALKNSVPTATSGIHDKHVTNADADYIATDCAACHGTDADTAGHSGHGQLNGVDFDAALIYSQANTNCTNACHLAADINDWSNAGSLACDDCHNALGKTLYVSGSLNATTPPATGEHAQHEASPLIGTCTTCHPHSGALGDSANTKHVNGTLASSIDVDGARITDVDLVAAGVQTQTVGGWAGNCTNTCHSATTAALWTNGALNLSCNDCHNKAANTLGAPVHADLSNSAGPASGKHSQHVGASASYMGTEACVTCHKHKGELGASGLAAEHATGAISYDAAVTDYVSGDQTCTNVCHNVVDTRDWTAGTLACTDCHTTAKTLGAAGAAGMSAGVAPATGRHTVHMNSNNYVPNNCTDCHGHSGALNKGANGHVAGPGKTSIGMGSQTTSYNGTDNTCVNTCHLVVDGRDWTTGAASNGTALACADCHNAPGKSLNQGSAWPPTSFAHSGHMASNALPNAAQSDCYSCHGNTTNSSGSLAGTGHLNLTAGDLGFASSFNYQGSAVATGGAAGTSRTCSNVLCHNGETTPTWGAGTIGCGQCHNTGLAGPLPSGSIAGDHALHANNDSNYSDCDNCHVGAASYTAAGGHANHQNLAVNVVFTAATLPGASYTDGDGGAGVNYSGDFTDDGTCASVECHFNADTPAWNAAASAYPARCVVCHNDGTAGTALQNSVPAATNAIHDKHVTGADSDYVATDCGECHGTNAETAGHSGHGQLNGVDFAAGFTYSAANKNCSNACHNAPELNDWTNAATLACDDCHNAAGKTLYVSGPLNATTPPATGEHAQHDGNPLVGTCTTCHPHSGALGNSAVTKHVNGSAATSIDVDGTTISDVDLVTGLNQTQTVAGWAGNCTNTCHSATGANLWTSGALTLACDDCHNKAANTLGAPIHAGMSNSAGPATGKHGSHVGAAVSYMGAEACVTCHKHKGELGATGLAADHATGAVSYDAANTDYVSGTQTCTNVCHTVVDGRDWTIGTLNCDDCHGAVGKSLYRSRTGGSHAAHYSASPTAADISRNGNDSTTTYNYGCATCHPVSHIDGSNRAVLAGISYSGGAAGTCGTNSCHQDGQGGAPLATPTWGTAFTGDKCAKCHGNSPSSNAHGVHAVGIHYADIFSGSAGLLSTVTATKSHGNAATSSTINCNTCHNSVVTSSANANNSICISCHTDSAIPATGNAAAAIANKQLHVDGSPQVVFALAGFKSKAQLRDDISTVESVNDSWARSGSYKDAAGYDQANVTPGPSFAAGSCSTIDCHNGQPATWTDSSVSCNYCHVSTPQ